MQAFNIIPFASFLFFQVFLTSRILILRRKGIAVSKSQGITKKSTLLLYSFFGIIFLIWLFEIIKPVLQFSFSILPELFTKELFEIYFLKITGTVIIFLSLVSWTITLVHFKTSLRFGLNENNPGKLITTGIFSVSRNPFFLSLDLYLIGIVSIFPNLFFIGFTVLSIISIHSFILKEEKFLSKVYGDEYKKYSGNVRRYF